MTEELRLQVKTAATHLAAGRCVAMPTETVYGLAARIDSEKALRAVFSHKKRPSFDPLIVHISNINQVAPLVSEWPPAAAALASRFWPGALTIVVKKSDAISSIISAGLETVGLRLPNHAIARALIDETGVPLAAPSANRFGRTSPTTADHVRSEFPEAVSKNEILILDGGPCHLGVESTVCRVTVDEVLILRPGGVTEEELQAHLASSSDEKLKKIKVRRAHGHSSSPGHTEHHYETKKPLIVVWSPEDPTENFIEVGDRKIAKDKISEIELSTDPALAARELYAKLREADLELNSEALLIRRDTSAENFDAGLWLAIDDRLGRAARRTVGSKPSKPLPVVKRK